ncbi:MAG: hypothetical protein PHN57_04780 [Candidatus Omnitrophica bacterium]|nr:hypothetical protein [Candidatus Omnitrophota bacterium]
MKDLFDFSIKSKNDASRSGKISGTILQELDYNQVSGAKSKSFLKNGTDYLTELHLNMSEKLPKDYNFEGQWFIRKTDNSRIEARRDIRLKDVNLKIYNPQNLAEFGDFYGEFSQFVLGASLEGLNTEASPSGKEKYKILIARTGQADEAASLFQRDVAGIKADRYFFDNSNIFSSFRVGAQAVTVHDDSAGFERTASTKELHNTVAGIDGEVTFRKILSFIYEFAGSTHMEDKETSTHDQNASALRLQPQLNIGKVNLRYLYYYVQPKFFSAVGSAAPDKMQHQITADIQLNRKTLLSLTENYYWDHLTGSTLTKRTTNDEKYITLNLRPFDARQNLVLRTYANYQGRTSDDTGHSASGITRTLGFSVNDSLDENTTGGVSYEYRGFTDTASRSSSDYFNRVGFNLARDQKFFNRRLYCSFDPAVDLRSTKSSNKKDVNINVGLTAQYDVSQRMIMRLGNNIFDTNSSKPSADYFNNRSYWEFDYLVNKARATRFILRGERNRFCHEDGGQTFNEQRVIGKLTTSF